MSVTSEEGRGTTFTVSVRTGTAYLPPDRISVDRHMTSTSVGSTPFVEEASRWLPGDAAPLTPRPATSHGAWATLAPGLHSLTAMPGFGGPRVTASPARHTPAPLATTQSTTPGGQDPNSQGAMDPNG